MLRRFCCTILLSRTGDLEAQFKPHRQSEMTRVFRDALSVVTMWYQDAAGKSKAADEENGAAENGWSPEVLEVMLSMNSLS